MARRAPPPPDGGAPGEGSNPRWEAWIGLECHVQLDTCSKLFCDCPVDPTLPPNAATCWICLGHPGAMPALNERAVALALRSAAALGCEIDPASTFDRKHYRYPDLPRGYQITQRRRPLARGGQLRFEVGGAICAAPLVGLHMEEDSGRLTHREDGVEIDWNRAGAPLIEIVSAPTLRSGAEAEAWARALRDLLVEAGVTRGQLQDGNMRFDANVSTRRSGPAAEPLPAPSGEATRVELKNLNSFRFLRLAVEQEIARQREVLASGGQLRQHTRGWTGQGTRALRGKETAAAYRYAPEPDLPPLRLTGAEIAAARAALPAAPMDLWRLDRAAAARDRWLALGLDDEAARLLCSRPALASLMGAALDAGGAPERMIHWVRGDVSRLVNEGLELDASPLRGADLAALQAAVDGGDLTLRVARKILANRAGGGEPVSAQIRSHAPLRDPAALRALAEAAVRAQPSLAERFRAGESKLLGFFIGQIMRASGGRAAPKAAAEAARAALGAA